jgi:hypothetical protein
MASIPIAEDLTLDHRRTDQNERGQAEQNHGSPKGSPTCPKEAEPPILPVPAAIGSHRPVPHFRDFASAAGSIVAGNVTMNAGPAVPWQQYPIITTGRIELIGNANDRSAVPQTPKEIPGLNENVCFSTDLRPSPTNRTLTDFPSIPGTILSRSGHANQLAEGEFPCLIDHSPRSVRPAPWC